MIDGVGPDGKKILKGTNENSDKYYNIDTGTYETEKERANRIASEKLSDPNSLESIKDELYRAEGFEDGQKYVESITTYLDDSDLADINKTLEGKKWAINVTNDQ